MKLKKIAAAIAAAAIAASFMSGCENAEAVTQEQIQTHEQTAEQTNEQEQQMRDITTMELVQEMGLGINLGNTFESCGDWISNTSVTNYETGWGSPVVTEELIKGYKSCGFGVLRVPVAWSNMMAEDYTINPDYLARVKQVVDWALDADLYVIMNIHWDGGWFEGFGKDDKREECFKKYESVWTQLTEAFKDYGDKLMFESLNEEGGWDEIWNRYSNQGDKEKSYGVLNDMNQRFVNIVRKSGGNNAKRHLLIAGYNTDIELTCDELFKMPNDTENRCAVSVHYYTPAVFALLETDADWGKARADWGTNEDIAELDKLMDMMKTNFVDKGIPVIFGEYGVATKNKSPEMVRKYVGAVCEAIYTRGMCPVLWDITDHFYDRTNFDFKDPQLLEELMNKKDLERK